MDYRPKEINNLDCAMRLLIPTYGEYNGVTTKKYPADGPLFFANFKTYGGTERVTNDLYAIEDTANIETWFRPDITSGCVLELNKNARYEIISEPENINMRNQFLKFKVRRIKGGA